MKRALLFILISLILSGCINIFGSGQADLPSLVPEKADLYAVIHVDKITQDKDFQDLSKNLKNISKEFYGNQFSTIYQNLPNNPSAYSGVNTELVFIGFPKPSDSGQQASIGLDYFAVILQGSLNKDVLLSNLTSTENYISSKETYDNTEITLLKINSTYINELADNLTKGAENQNSNYYQNEKERLAKNYGSLFNQTFAFAPIDENDAVFGSESAVKDVLDVKAGKLKHLDDPNINVLLPKLNTNSLVYLVLRIPLVSSTSSHYGDILGTLNSLGVSFDKQDQDMQVLVAVNFNDSSTASKNADKIDGGIKLARGSLGENSGLEKIASKILSSAEVKSDNTIVTLKISFTVQDAVELYTALKDWLKQYQSSNSYQYHYKNDNYRSDKSQYYTPETAPKNYSFHVAGHPEIDASKITIYPYYFVPNDRKPMDNYSAIIAQRLEKIKAFHSREFSNISTVEFETPQTIAGTYNSSYYRGCSNSSLWTGITSDDAFSELTSNLSSDTGFPVILIFSDIGCESGTDVCKKYYQYACSNNTLLADECGGTAGTFVDDVNPYGIGLVSPEAWKYDVGGADGLVYTVGIGDPLNFPSLKPVDNSVMGYAQYQCYSINDEWINPKQKAQVTD